jgi:hypothetical protein
MYAVLRAIAAGAAVGILPLSASAQDLAAQVRGYLEHGMDVHESAGFDREHTVPDLVAPLSLDGPRLWPVYLREGVRYRVYGACDDNCGDLDLELYASDGRLVARDVAPNDTPFVEITPGATGRHYVRLWLYACEAATCHVAARVVSSTAAAAEP